MVILVCALYSITIVVDYKSQFTNFAAIAILFTVAVYMNRLVHGLDDPFDGPPDFHFNCYVQGRVIELTFYEAWKNSLTVDFACLTAEFGSTLRQLIADSEGDADGEKHAATAHHHAAGAEEHALHASAHSHVAAAGEERHGEARINPLHR